VHQMPFFCVSIALAEKGDVCFGVIYDPIKDELFVAERGKGTKLNGRLMNVSDESCVENSLLSTNIPRLVGGSIKIDSIELFSLHSRARGMRALGSTALQLAYVAVGRLSGYWGYNLETWDLAAASLMVSEAGG